MKLLIPQEILTWLDAHRGSHSRQAFIIMIVKNFITSQNLKTIEALNGDIIKPEQGEDR